MPAILFVTPLMKPLGAWGVRLSGPVVCGVGYIGSTGLLVTDEGMGPGMMAATRWTLVVQPTMDACPNKF